MSGCVFSVLLQKVKIKTQNELTGHPSASLSIYKDVKIIIKISNQCFKAVKSEYSAFKVVRRQPILTLAPGPLQRLPIFVLSAIVQKFFDRSIVIFKSKSRRNHEQKVNKVILNFDCYCLQCHVIFMLAPGPLFVLSAIIQKFFDRSIVVFKSKSRHSKSKSKSSICEIQCFKAVKCEYSAFKVVRRRPILMLAPGPFFVLSAISCFHVKTSPTVVFNLKMSQQSRWYVKTNKHMNERTNEQTNERS